MQENIYSKKLIPERIREITFINIKLAVKFNIIVNEYITTINMILSIPKHKLISITFFLLSFVFIGNAQTKEPNVLLILTDDQGWSNTSVQMKKGMPESKSDFFQTPALEKMAEKGMVFSQSYAPAPTCTPTRTSLQFGKTPARLRNTVVNDVVSEKMNYNLRHEQSLHQLIKNVNPNYTTAHFGKWGIDVRKPEYDFGDGNTNKGR